MVQELDAKLSSCRQELGELSPLENNDRYGAQQLKDYMDHWDELDIDDKRGVVDQLILVIHATEDSCEIKWKI